LSVGRRPGLLGRPDAQGSATVVAATPGSAPGSRCCLHDTRHPRRRARPRPCPVGTATREEPRTSLDAAQARELGLLQMSTVRGGRVPMTCRERQRHGGGDQHGTSYREPREDSAEEAAVGRARGATDPRVSRRRRWPRPGQQAAPPPRYRSWATQPSSCIQAGGTQGEAAQAAW